MKNMFNFLKNNFLKKKRQYKYEVVVTEATGEWHRDFETLEKAQEFIARYGKPTLIEKK